MGNWEDWEDWDENCLEGRRRRLMRRGTRTTREEGGEGERGEGREDESSCLWFVVEKALLFAAVAVWVVGFLRFVYLDRAIPVQRSTPGGHSLACRVVSLFETDFSKENRLILFNGRCANRSEESTRMRDYFVGDFCSSLSESAACSTCPPGPATNNRKQRVPPRTRDSHV